MKFVDVIAKKCNIIHKQMDIFYATVTYNIFMFYSQVTSDG